MSEVTRGLCIRLPWIGYILDGQKDWEIRSAPTRIRETVALIQSTTGLIVGVADLIDVVGPLSDAELHRHQQRHCVPHEQIAHITYATPYAWVLRNPVRFHRPVPYAHPSGAVIWVTLSTSERRAVNRRRMVTA